MQKEKYFKLIGEVLLKKLPPASLIIFYGSLIKENFDRLSDIDVAIFSPQGLSAKTMMEIYSELEKIPLPREIDLVDLGRVENPDFIERVISEGLIWKSSEEALRALKSRLESLKKQ